MADEEHRAPGARLRLELSKTFSLKREVADCKRFVHDQDVRFEVRGNGEGQPNVHATRVALDYRIDELVDLREIDDFVELPRHFLAFHPQNRPVEEDVLAAGQLGMKAGANFQQRPEAAANLCMARARSGHPREDLQQGALASAVAPDDSNDLTPRDVERNIPERQVSRAFCPELTAEERSSAGGQVLSHGVLPTPPRAERVSLGEP